METTAHKPYADYRTGRTRPILAYEVTESDRIPLVPNDSGNLVPADELGEYEIVAERLKQHQREILHG